MKRGINVDALAKQNVNEFLIEKNVLSVESRGMFFEVELLFVIKLSKTVKLNFSKFGCENKQKKSNLSFFFRTLFIRVSVYYCNYSHFAK